VDANFEHAVDSLLIGDVETVVSLVTAMPRLVRARSHHPHQATLLHYLAANGVEQERQRSPANAPEIARILLSHGAHADALAEMYGGQYTTMSMLVSGVHPAQAGVQSALVETLLDFGAAIEGVGSGETPLITALAFGYREAAEALAERGASVENLVAAAGLGRIALVAQLFPSASAEERHRALALAAQHGQADIVQLLLEAGEDPNRFNPAGFHGHSTPLHQAVYNGHTEVVHLLVERHARLDLRDTVYQGTPLDWAKHAGNETMIEYLSRLK
jgi:ankyrin repeat protein